MKVRIALLCLVAAMLVLRSMHSPDLAAAGLVGLAAGAALAYVGLRLTQFDRMPAGIFYTPNGTIGAILSALLLGRLAYRFFVLYPTVQSAHAEGADPFSAFQRSPLTLALFGIVIGYYIAYSIGLLVRSRALREAPALDRADAASPPSGP
jgi:hypothetical protein